jgi:hypothetical protein
MLWWAINHILFLSCWLVIAQTIPKTASILPASIVCFSIFMPVQFAFVNGQTSILVLLLLALALRSLLSDRDFTAGLLFSLAMVKPQLVLPAFAVLAIRRSRRFTFGFICGGVCELVLSIVMVGFAGVRSYLPFLHFFGTLPNSISGTHPEEMANIRGLLFRLHYDSGLALGILSVLVVVLAIVLTRRSKLEVQFAVAIAAGLMVSFHALPHELTLLILPFMIAVGQLIDRKIVGVKLIAATLISLGLIWSSALLLNPMITLVLMAAFCYTLTITEMDSEAHLDAHSLTADSD